MAGGDTAHTSRTEAGVRVSAACTPIDVSPGAAVKGLLRSDVPLRAHREESIALTCDPIQRLENRTPMRHELTARAWLRP